MPRLTGALLILIATTTGCTRPAAQSPGPMPAASTTSDAPRPTVTISPATSISPITTTPSSAPTTSVSVGATSQSPGNFASDLIQGLIDRKPTVAAFDTSLWSGALDGGSIVQVASLSNSAGRADVAVSIAFQETATDGNTEPIGLRVQLHSSGGNWVVDGIGYL